MVTSSSTAIGHALAPGSDLTNEAQRLIYHEADLLDQGRYDEWFSLFSNTATYWIPSWKSEFELVEDVTKELSYIYLTHDMLRDYVVRMNSSSAFVMGPGLRTTRLIGNLQFEDGQPMCVNSRWVMHVYRRHQSELFSGQCKHEFVVQEGRLLIAAKRVVLINDQFEFGHMPLV
ncbi:MAG: aromatic-ring-hydroxylating dioxygenase subunit beta [Pigmentiphaga sp.]